MKLENNGRARVLCLHAAAKRLQIPERTLRYRASRGRIEGAFKQGKLWKFPLTALENGPGKRMAAIGLMLAVLFLAWPAAAGASESAPGFSLTDTRGKTVRLSAYKGKVVVVDFWATWCHGCKEEIPWFMEFQKKYKHQGLTVIGVSMDEDGWKAVKPFVKQKRMNYQVVLGSEELASRYRLESMPLTVLIGRDGRIAASYSGVVEKDVFEKELRAALARH